MPPKKRLVKRTRPRHEFCAIIPCSGKGTRVGSPEDGKEMLLDPVTGLPLIHYSVKLALECGFKPVIIYSSNKTKLRAYLVKEFGEGVCIFTKHDPKGNEEWPHSVLSAEKHWGRLNVLILPDVRFSPPIETLLGIKALIKKNEAAFATVNVEDGSKFAVVKEDANGIIYTAEKPKSLSGKTAQAWGLIGFTKKRGRLIFSAYTRFQAWIGMPKEKVGILKLAWFKDITRDGKVEEYGEAF